MSPCSPPLPQLLTSPQASVHLSLEDDTQGVTFTHRLKRVQANQSVQCILCIPLKGEGGRCRGGVGWRRQTQVQSPTGLEEADFREGRGCYSPTAFPFACVGGLLECWLWGDPTGGACGTRGASAEFPLTLMCSHPPWKTNIR